MPERIEAVLGLREQGHGVIRSTWGNREALKEIAMSQDHNHSNPATWECKYHVVFTPKYRKKLLFGQIQYSTNWPGAQAQGMQDRRGTTPDARPCAYADLDPAKIFGGG